MFRSVCMCMLLCVCVFISVCEHTKTSTPPPHICLSPPFAALSGHNLLRTHTSDSTTGQDHKSKASSSLVAKKTQGCFSPSKRAIKSASQGVTHLSGPPHGKHSTHNPPAIQSVSVLAAESSIKSLSMHLFNTKALIVLGSMPTVYCDENSLSASVDLSNNKLYHQLVTEYGYLHPFAHGQMHQHTSTCLHRFPPVHQHLP